MNTPRQQSLLVIAQEQSVLLWRMVGAHGEVFSPARIREIVTYIKEHPGAHQAALVGESVYEEGYPVIRQLNESEIPWIMLLDTSTDEKIGYKELQRLSERAIGMSLAIH